MLSLLRQPRDPKLSTVTVLGTGLGHTSAQHRVLQPKASGFKCFTGLSLPSSWNYMCTTVYHHFMTLCIFPNQVPNLYCLLPPLSVYFLKSGSQFPHMHTLVPQLPFPSSYDGNLIFIPFSNGCCSALLLPLPHRKNHYLRHPVSQHFGYTFIP